MRILRYGCNTKQASDALDLAFNKKRADDRKAWIMESDPEAVLDYGAASSADTAPLVDAADFVHKELIHFSIANLERSIPSGIDGLKVSQRKILWGAFRRRMTAKTEVKVAQFGCYVAEHSAYHHGETSLQDAVIGMAQDFVGANNVALLRGAGQFGTRLQGGKDAASARYVFVALDDVASAAFPPADAPILRYQTDDGQVVEPVNYLPVIPWALVNGASGIGTGFSTTVPSYHPLQLIEAVRAKLDDPVNAKPPALKPWVAGFTGDIVPLRGGRGHLSKGRWKKLPASKSSQVSVEITELPVGIWTADYKTFLDELVQQQPPTTPLRDFECHYTDRTVRFVLHLAAGEATEALWTADPRQANLLEPGETPITRFESVFHLTNARTLTTSNMHLYDAARRIRRYEDAHQILDEHFAARMIGYTKRREYCIKQLEREVALLRARVRFIGEVGSGSLKVHGVSRAALATELKKREYTADNDPKSADESLDTAEHAESDNNDGYGFLLRMNIGTLTAERAAQLAAKAKAAEDELDALLAKTPSDLWKEDLDVLEKAWRGYEARREERAGEDAAGGAASTQAKAAKQGRKAPAKAKASSSSTGRV
jgi:DNA topoisomerase-2